MTSLQEKILIAGIKIKLSRGENLETILNLYINLTEDKKNEIRLNI